LGKGLRHGTKKENMAKRKKIGEILVENGACAQEQVDECLRIQLERGAGRRLGEILIENEYITEDQLLAGLSLQTGIPFANEIDEDMIDRQLLEQVPFTFARKNNMIPLYADNGLVTVAVADPLNMQPLDDIGLLLNKEVTAVMCRESDISAAINRCYHQDSRAAEKIVEDMVGDRQEEVYHIEEETTDLLEIADKAPIIKLVNVIIFQAIKERASDIHIEIYEKDLKIRYRIDGVLYVRLTPPKQYHASIVSRVKIMAKLNIAERRLPQDGKIAIKVGERDVDIRVSVIPTIYGERVVLRLLDRSTIFLGLEELGLNPETYKQMTRLIKMSHGIILVTGPTGSGKTTTLYAALSKINSEDLNIITTEDPVEYQLDGIGQINVKPKIGLTFANGLRSILRQDPDVIMVGEIRDLETAEIATHASLTGHLVFSTLHTNDSSGAITRLVDMGVEPYLVASSLLAVIAQRLVRRICPHCKSAQDVGPEDLEEIGLTVEKLADGNVYIGRGCKYCLNTGYSGRTGIYELLTINNDVRQEIMKNTDSGTIKQICVSRGMKTLRTDGALKVAQGMTTGEITNARL